MARLGKFRGDLFSSPPFVEVSQVGLATSNTAPDYQYMFITLGMWMSVIAT